MSPCHVAGSQVFSTRALTWHDRPASAEHWKSLSSKMLSKHTAQLGLFVSSHRKPLALTVSLSLPVKGPLFLTERSPSHSQWGTGAAEQSPADTAAFVDNSLSPCNFQSLNHCSRQGDALTGGFPKSSPVKFSAWASAHGRLYSCRKQRSGCCPLCLPGCEEACFTALSYHRLPQTTPGTTCVHLGPPRVG